MPFRVEVFGTVTSRNLPARKGILALRHAHPTTLIGGSRLRLPSMTASTINNLGFGPDTVQLRVAQLGCANRVPAIHRALDFVLAPPGNPIACSRRMRSARYATSPRSLEIDNLLPSSLIGDATAAAVAVAHGEAGRTIRA